MKKLYRGGTVHPSPSITADHLSFLPATILIPAAALSPEDKQVLAYLISCSNNNFVNFRSHGHPKNTPKTQTKRKSEHGHDHLPLFSCDCFRCYMSYWVKWDSSSNRQLIHEIIDAFEDEIAQSNKKTTKSRKERKKKGGSGELKRPGSSELKTVEQSGGGGCEVCGDAGGEEGKEKGSVRRLVNFIGERIWNVWGQ